jgi:hypothetical protein
LLVVEFLGSYPLVVLLDFDQIAEFLPGEAEMLMVLLVGFDALGAEHLEAGLVGAEVSEELVFMFGAVLLDLLGSLAEGVPAESTHRNDIIIAFANKINIFA